MLPGAEPAAQASLQAREGTPRPQRPCAWSGRRPATAWPCRGSPGAPRLPARRGHERRCHERPAGPLARCPGRIAGRPRRCQLVRRPSRRHVAIVARRQRAAARHPRSGPSAARASVLGRRQSSHPSREMAGAGLRRQSSGRLQTAPGSAMGRHPCPRTVHAACLPRSPLPWPRGKGRRLESRGRAPLARTWRCDPGYRAESSAATESLRRSARPPGTLRRERQRRWRARALALALARAALPTIARAAAAATAPLGAARARNARPCGCARAGRSEAEAHPSLSLRGSTASRDSCRWGRRC
mmetsp:Transcript_24469/g.92440  ORF Transcript_24469/g.92440 Transcript_24469/m.92440 type:complete len:300 (-) Transcript_24469:1369-2268(-)